MCPGIAPMQLIARKSNRSSAASLLPMQMLQLLLSSRWEMEAFNHACVST